MKKIVFGFASAALVENGGTGMKRPPTSCNAVRPYRLVLPVFSPEGLLRSHLKTRLVPAQLQRADASCLLLVLGPDRTTFTLPATASAAASADVSGLPDASPRVKMTAIFDPALLSEL